MGDKLKNSVGEEMFYPICKIEVYIARTMIDRWNERKNRWNLKFHEGLKGVHKRNLIGVNQLMLH